MKKRTGSNKFDGLDRQGFPHAVETSQNGVWRAIQNFGVLCMATSGAIAAEITSLPYVGQVASRIQLQGDIRYEAKVSRRAETFLHKTRLRDVTPMAHFIGDLGSHA
jgi:hypothetical protein